MKQGYQVTSLSLQDHSDKTPLLNVEEIAVNLTQADELRACLQGRSFHYIIHCAGYIAHTLFKDGGRSLIHQHFLSVMNLVEALNRDKLEAFVQVGSSDEYGDAPAPQKESFRESSISPYSFGKVASTHFLQMLHRTENFPAVMLRLFLTYGPGQNNKRFLPQIIQGCLDDKSFPTSAGEQLRDFCFITDIAEGTFKALNSPQAFGEVINLASGKAISIREMIEKITQMVGKGKPEFGAFPYRVGENMGLYADIEKAQNLLGWEPGTSLEEGLKQTIDYYRNT